MNILPLWLKSMNDTIQERFMGSVSDCRVRVNKGQDHRKYLGVSSGVSIEIFPNKLLYISMICYRLSFHPLRQDISKDILLSMSFSFLLSPSFAIFSAAFDAVFSRLTTLFFMGIVSCLGGVLAREWHASFCAYDNVCKIFTLFFENTIM